MSVTTSFSPRTGTDVDANKRVVRNFLAVCFNEHQPARAAALYTLPTYRQHNPNLGDGQEAFVQYFEGFFRQFPTVHSTIIRMVAENDLVAVHSHSKNDAADRGTAIMDVFRLENGRIAEHWDVIQPVPAQSANSNTMF